MNRFYSVFFDLCLTLIKERKLKEKRCLINKNHYQ
jgi:hypothetical protein